MYKKGEGVFSGRRNRMNKNNINGKIRETGLTYQKLAKKIGISVTSVNYKVNGQNFFNHEEMIKLREILRLTDNEIIEIFFHKVV